MEKRRRRIPVKRDPEFTSKPGEKEDPKNDSSTEEPGKLPEPGELTQEKEDPKSGNIGKNNAGGYE